MPDTEKVVAAYEMPSDRDLRSLAPHLALSLGARLLELLDASNDAHELIDCRERAQRAEDLAQECRRQLKVRDRQLDDLIEARREAMDWIHGTDRAGGLDGRFASPLGLVRALIQTAESRILPPGSGGTA